MQIIVMSDTHGEKDRSIQLFQEYLNADLFIHCGDIGYNTDDLPPCVYVQGNHDRGIQLARYQILNEQNHRIYVTHGDIWEKEIMDGIVIQADMDYEQLQIQLMKQLEECLYHEAIALGCDIVLYGHTHMASIRHRQGIWLINPGSLGFQHSYAMIELDKEVQAVIKKGKSE